MSGPLRSFDQDGENHRFGPKSNDFLACLRLFKTGFFGLAGLQLAIHRDQLVYSVFIPILSRYAAIVYFFFRFEAVPGCR